MGKFTVIDATLTSYLARLFYIGNDFHGSQAQPGLRTVQGELVSALTEWDNMDHSTKTVRLSGRTDRGVHSIGQIVMITTERIFDINKINRYLPDDVCLWAHTSVHDTFNPRRDVLFRHYRYVLEKSDSMDIKRMRNAAQILVGTHNFKYLSKRDGERPTITTISNIFVGDTSNCIIIDIYGTSFLWKLVRKIVTLLELVGHREVKLETVREIVQAEKTVPMGIRPAPPECLFLMEAIVPLYLQPNKYAIRRMQKIISARVRSYRRLLLSFSTICDKICFQS